MMQSKVLIGIIFFSLILRLVIIGIHSNDPKYIIQQDNYTGYSQSLKNKISGIAEFPKDTLDSRLFPGYPILMLLVEPLFKFLIMSGLVISLISSLLSIYLFWLLTKSNWATFLFSLFPPVWVIQGTKIATEPITVFLLLLAIVLYKRNLFLFSGFILGFATDIRLISICLFLALVVHLYLNKNLRNFFLFIIGFLTTFSFLFLFNYLVFGESGIFQQFIVYPVHGRASFGGVQIIKDILRTIDWGQFRILISGLFYIIVNLFSVFQLYKYRKFSWLYQISFFWMILSLIFIFILGPTPLLEEFSRYTVPFVPALILGFFALLNNRRSGKVLKNKNHAK